MNYKIPPFQPQSSPPFDASSCSNEATIGVMEATMGKFQEFSVSGAAVLSGTVPGVGNDVTDVIAAMNRYGLISYAARPLPAVFNKAEYYAPITAEQRATANKSWQFALVAPDLSVSPILLRLKLTVGDVPPSYHFVFTEDNKNYIDSYEPQIKPITWSQVVGQNSLSIKPNFMTPGFQVPGIPTVYVMVGNSLVPLATWEAFINIGGSQSSIVPVTQQWLDSMAVVGNDYFGSK